MQDITRPPSAKELAWLRQAEEHVNDVAYRYWYDETGEGQLEHKEFDLQRAQSILRHEKYGARQLYELQCLGVVLGNVLVANTPMRWASVTNDFGTNLALRHPKTGLVLYPLSMIAKRVEAGREVDFKALYRSFVDGLGLGHKKPGVKKARVKKPGVKKRGVKKLGVKKSGVKKPQRRKKRQ